MHLSATAIAAATKGSVVGAEVELNGAGTDTRHLREGQLFIALVATRDGHDFLDQAIAAGAPAYLTNGPTRPGATAITVEDTAVALLALGAAARDRLAVPVVGITGSVGKTTVKELTAGVLATSLTTFASPESWNNEIGVPLTLLNAPDDVEVVILEMGARGPGHITTLCTVARPTVGIVTRIGATHTEFFGDETGVARAKAELIQALPLDGAAILNADDPRVAAMARTAACRVVTYGIDGAPHCQADVRATSVMLDELAHPRFTLHTPAGSAPVRLVLSGTHQVSNALAAAAAGVVHGLPVDAIAEGLGSVQSPKSRMAVGTHGGVHVLDDTYNANPLSTRAALHALSAFDGARKVAVLGTMAELGAESDALHREVADEAARLGIELVAFGTAAYGIPPVLEVDVALDLIGTLRAGDAVLVKASRAAGLEKVVVALLAALDTPVT